MFPVDLLPEAYRKSWCIAGGFAACPALATDMDVWVYGLPTEKQAPGKLLAVRDEILDYFAAYKKTRTYRDLWFGYTPGVETRTTESYGHPCVIHKVAMIHATGTRKPIHLMVTDADSPMMLIDGFDVSTHAVALNHDGGVFYNIDTYTPPNEPPRQLRDTVTTPDRLRKIAARFGHPTGVYGK